MTIDLATGKEDHSKAIGRTVWALAIASVCGAAGVVYSFGASWQRSHQSVIGAPASHETPTAPPQIFTMDTTLRLLSSKDGLHPDITGDVGAVQIGLVGGTLAADGLPALVSTTGKRLDREVYDKRGRPIAPQLYSKELGDTPGRASKLVSESIASKESFDTWFRDNNLSQKTDLIFEKQADSSKAIFLLSSDGSITGLDDAPLPPDYFTLDASTTFVHQPGREIRVGSAGDAWLYIDGKLVVDLGGVHLFREQVVSLDRLSWLEPGRTYELQLFYADRALGPRELRVETNVELRGGSDTSVASVPTD